MSPKWTASQQQALEIRGTNLLVSAGAGSGKTTVLTHRILERIKNGDSIGDFLVVTFTKASAGDLKRKLYVHNMGHATCAYLGDLLGLEYIYQSIDVADVRILVQNAMRSDFSFAGSAETYADLYLEMI